MRGTYQTIWRFFSFASAVILFAASLLFFINFSVGGYFASRMGADLNDLLFYSVYPAILSAIVLVLTAVDLPGKLFLLVGYYSMLERMARFDLCSREKLPGPRWFIVMGPMGGLADALLLQGKTEEAEKTYYQVAEYSKKAGLWATFLVGPSLENYAERLAATGRLLDYADWKGRFRGATVSRRIIIVLWLTMTVLAGQMALKYTAQNVPTIASYLSYLGRYELADSLLSAGLQCLRKFNPEAKTEENGFKVKMAQNDVRWGRLSDAEQLYLEVLPLRDILAGKHDAQIRDEMGALGMLQELAALKMRQGQPDAARKILDKLWKLYPSASLLITLTDLYLEEGQLKEAEETISRANAAVAKIVDPDNKDLIRLSATIRLGRLRMIEKNAAAAQAEFNTGLKRVNEAKGKLEVFRLPFLLGLMEAAHLEGDAKKEANCRTAVLEETLKLAKAKSPLEASVSCHQAAEAMARCGQYPYADQLLIDGMEMIEKATSPTNPAIASYYVRRGEIALAQGNVDAAAHLCQKAVNLINKKTLSSEHPAVLDAAVLAGRDANKLKMEEEAASFFTEVMRIIEKNGLQRIDAKVADALKQYEDMLLRHGNKTRAGEVQALLARTKVKQSGYN
ncbi:MAG: tetratricopeptide repeat protein [Candidatus Melainabacteria bacterium]|nr:tetratricopeptide repeat protein [Candidatus Melainabacteria bacterium]